MKRNIKKIIFSLPLVLLFGIMLKGQDNSERENYIMDNICRYLNENREKQDSTRLRESSELYLEPYLQYMDEDTADSVGYAIFIRLQKKCPEFYWILDKEALNESDEFFMSDESQTPIISDSELELFKNTSQFYYLLNENITYVKLDDGKWFEVFEDGTYVDTDFVWTSKFEFSLTFVESDNESKKAYSRKGEVYSYKLLGKGDNYYMMENFDPNLNKYFRFKLYIYRDERHEQKI